MASDSESDDIAIVRGRERSASRPVDASTKESGGTEEPEKGELPAPSGTGPVAPTSGRTRQAGKPSTSAQRKPKSASIEDVESYAFDLINRMKSIYKGDLDALRSGKPSTLKIDNVEDISNKVMRKEAQEACVKLGVLHEIRQWLEPLPDNSLPNQKVKKVLLDLLYNLRIRKVDLLDAGVGRIVHFYSKNPHEAKDVRKLAQNVVSRWKARIIREEIE